MLVLKKARLVFLANPKTATQALRAMLAPHAKATPQDIGDKHINAQIYHRKWANRIAARIGEVPETIAVMRQPVQHLNSWYRYRQRDALKGHENSTQGLSFADFIEAVLMEDPPPFARIGRQARFLGFLNDGPPVNYIFDFARLDLMVLFLSERLEVDLKLAVRNVSPEGAPNSMDLPEEVLARLHQAQMAEFALYAKVTDMGVLETHAAV